MTTALTPRAWTYKDYLGFPEGGPFRYEVIDGELYMTPAPNIRHQQIVERLLRKIGNFLEDNLAGTIFVSPCDVVFSADPLQVVQPDLVFVSAARSSIVTEQNIQGSPDLVIEVLSEGTMLRDRNQKLRLYERFGVLEYWIVDQEKNTVSVFRLSEGKYPEPVLFQKEDVLTSPLLPGLSFPVSSVFP